ncbi:uncharacterized protein BJX67DRAFT_235215 [Aspergillus lucknowensis]|uniref:Uncharacterized protein n=1 Tax=Aspergillus lucknowensis TaxID=176173 RepID=A0ABR4LI80_9EURO
METRSVRKKRCNSSGSNPGQHYPVLRDRTRQPDDAGVSSGCETPRPHKKVRFSDPGPLIQHAPDYSTGLTPAMCRTSFEEQEHNDISQRTPSRQSRRRSTPLPRARRVTDSQLPSDTSPAERVLHFTPLRQLLDMRTQRRIRRLGLSNEIANIERDKRAAARFEKSLDGLLRERDSLKQELELAKKNRVSLESQFTSDDGEWTAPQDRIERLESGNCRLWAQLSFSANQDSNREASESGSSTDTVLINESGFEGETLFMSDSPDIRGVDVRNPIPDDISLLSPKGLSIDASVQVSQPTRNMDPDFLALSRDLAAAKKEKNSLFEACRSHLDLLDGTALEHHLRRNSPPPDCLDDIIPSLMQTLARASEATRTLNIIQDELSTLGFNGANAVERVEELRNRFRAARLQLERAVPGETADAGLEDGNSTLSALIKRVEALVKDLGEERTRHQGSADRERALRGQFDALLVRYDAASRKIQDLEESISSSAGDMLHTRMRMQELEREAQEQVIGIERLNAALSKYHDEVKGLENLVTTLEDEKIQRVGAHNRQLTELEQKFAKEEQARCAADATIAEREKQIHELKEVIEQNEIQFCDLTARVETIERARSEAVEILERTTAEQALKHDQELGLMNVRVSELNTALETAKAEAEKLRLSNAGLEEQLRLEVESRDRLLDHWAAEQTRAYTSMKAMVNTERRKAKVRAANWELKSDELHSDSMGIGSEPITPVSMTRFVDVEVGRGKHRRRLDSGIGILTEDEFEEDVDQQLLPSDPADL